MFDEHPPGHDHPTPVNLRIARGPRRWLLPAVAALAVVAGIAAIMIFLVLPPLMQPPPTPGPVYEIFQFGEISRSISPTRDHLLELDGGQVSLYVPAGAHPVGGTMVLQPRSGEFIPQRIDGRLERIQAVDVTMIDSQGNIVLNPNFEPELLLCFRLSDSAQRLQEEDPSAVMIEQFDESPDVLEWTRLEAGPGWDLNQICSPLSHLSILALTVRHKAPTATPRATPRSGPTPTPMPPDIYSLPESNP